MKPTDSLLALWRRVLGEVPAADSLGRIESLNQIPDDVVAAARRLGSARRAAGLISSYLRSDRQILVDLFVEEVVFGKQAAPDWQRGRKLVPAWSFSDQVTLPRDRLLAPIAGHVERRTVPNIRSWQAKTSWVGAPCLEQPEADYLTLEPADAAGLSWSEPSEPAGELEVCLRRWIAARIASVTHARLGLNFADAGRVAEAFAPLPSWTSDARAALRGLLRESRELGERLDAPPGFRGPDEWFRGEST